MRTFVSCAVLLSAAAASGEPKVAAPPEKVTAYVMFLTELAGGNLLGQWSEGRFQLYPEFNKERGSCPPTLPGPSCGWYRTKSQEDSNRFSDAKSFGLLGAPATVHGKRVGTYNGFGVTPDDPDQARLWGERCRASYPGTDCVFMVENTLVTHAPVAEPKGWRRIPLTRPELDDLEARSWKYLLASNPPEKLKREDPTELVFEAFEAGGRRIEFASVSYQTEVEGSDWGMSLAWGLVKPGQPFLFHGPEQTGYTHFYRLKHAVDLGADGTTELILYYTTNSSSIWEIWQLKVSTVELIGLVQGPKAARQTAGNSSIAS